MFVERLIQFICFFFVFIDCDKRLELACVKDSVSKIKN